MKPELKALWKAILDAPVGDPGGLHWRGDELWCGPIQFGGIERASTPGKPGVTRGYYGWLHPEDSLKWFSSTKEEARAATEAAAQEQIRTWMEES